MPLTYALCKYSHIVYFKSSLNIDFVSYVFQICIAYSNLCILSNESILDAKLPGCGSN